MCERERERERERRGRLLAAALDAGPDGVGVADDVDDADAVLRVPAERGRAGEVEGGWGEVGNKGGIEGRGVREGGKNLPRSGLRGV